MSFASQRSRTPVATLAAVVLIAGWSSGCSPGISPYYGTGALQASASTTLLAPQQVMLRWCEGDREPVDRTESFFIVSIGDQCTIEGAEIGDTLVPDPGTQCRLSFSEGNRTLRIDRVSRHFGIRAATYIPPATYIPASSTDTGRVELEVGGREVTSNNYQVYRFSGTAGTPIDPPWRCDDERARRDRKTNVAATVSAR